MKKYVSILLVAVLSSSILAGCGGSGKSVQQPARETQEKAAQSEKTEETGAQEDAAQADADNTGSAESDSVMDFPLAGFTFDAPEEFNHLLGEIRSKDIGEIGNTGVVIGYVAYQAKTTAEAEEYFNTLGVTTVEDITDEVREKMEKFYEDTPTLLLFRVMGVKGDQDLEELKKQMFEFPVSVFDELGTAGDYKFYYVVLDNEEYFEELRNTNYPKDKLDEAYKLWQEAATTSNFKDRVTIKEPISIYPSVEDEAAVSFETQDLDGNPVTSKELFAGHKITMINIWATWCINCRSEMKELEELNKEWAEKGCQIIGICDDAEDDEMVSLAKRILEEHGVTFRNVRSNDAIRDEQLPAVGMPTSYFVDSEGKILCPPIVGKNVEQYSENLQELLSEME